MNAPLRKFATLGYAQRVTPYVNDIAREDIFTAIATDGTAWVFREFTGDWEELPRLPQPPAKGLMGPVKPVGGAP